MRDGHLVLRGNGKEIIVDSGDECPSKDNCEYRHNLGKELYTSGRNQDIIWMDTMCNFGCNACPEYRRKN